MRYEILQRGRLFGFTRMLHLFVKQTNIRGSYSLYHFFLSKLSGSKNTIAILNEDTIFSYPNLDYYWDYYIKGERLYEEEIYNLLIKLRSNSYFFLDCGANFGYWSLLVTSSALGRKRAVAVEASRATFATLEANASLNDGRFAVRHLAVARTAGERVSFEVGGAHAGRSITPEGGETVTTTTIDTLVDEIGGGLSSVICKLDVESAEVEAIAGARNVLAGDSIFIYEDHGKDLACVSTAAFLELGCDVFFLMPSGDLAPIFSVEGARQVKSNRYKGYNFLAFGKGRGALREALLR